MAFAGAYEMIAFPTKKSAGKHVAVMLKRIEEANSAGRQKRVRHLVGRYLNSLDARYLAVLEAYSSLKRHRRPNVELLPSYACELNPWNKAKEKIVLRLKLKPNGDTRSIKVFGIENRARQYLVLPILQRLGQLHPNQYGTKGTHQAIERVAALLAGGYVWATEIDIHDCFSSFDREMAPCHILLPEEVTRNVLFCDASNMTFDNESTFGPASDEEDYDTFPELFADAQRGFPQGSAASSYAVEILLASLFDAVPAWGEIIGYVDNFLVMAKDERDAVSMTQAFGSALKAHPAGHLRPNKPKMFEAAGFVEYLGHQMSLKGGTVKIQPTPKNRQKFEVEFRRGLYAIKNGKNPKLLERFVFSWCAAFKLWDGALALRADSLSAIRKVSSSVA